MTHDPRRKLRLCKVCRGGRTRHPSRLCNECRRSVDPAEVLTDAVVAAIRWGDR